MDQPFWQTAGYLAQLGIRVFPLAWQSKEPYWPEVSWNQYASNDTRTFSSIFPQNASCGLAIVLGPSSGIMDVEFDGEEAPQTWAEINGGQYEIPTVTYQSARGTHRLYRWDGELAHAKNLIKYRGIEVRLGDHEKSFYSAVPPSLHPTGVWYQWLPGRAPWEIAIAPFPAHLQEFFKGFVASHRNEVQVVQQGEDYLPEPGNRHDYMLRLTQMLRGHLRLPAELVVDMVRHVSEHVGKYDELGPDKAEKELADMVSTIQLASIPENEFKGIDFGMIYDDARTMLAHVKSREAAVEKEQEIPPNIFPQWAEQMSQWAYASQMPRNLFLKTMLSGVAAAIGSSMEIRCSPDAMPTGLQLYMMGVGGPSSGKSKIMKALLGVFADHESFVTESTPEALRTALYMNKRGVLLKLVEGGKFTRMLGKYVTGGDGTESTDNSILLEAWSGDTISVVRQDVRKSFKIEHPCLNVAAAIQPYNLQTFSVQDVYEGLMQRMLIFSSGSVPEDVDLRCQRALSDAIPYYHEALGRLMSIRPYVYRNDVGALWQSAANMGQQERLLATTPLQAILDIEGQKIFAEYAKWKRSSEQLGQFSEGHPFQGDLMRHAEIALRYAGSLYMMHLSTDEATFRSAGTEMYPGIWIPSEWMRRGIALMEWDWSQKLLWMSDIVEDRVMKANLAGDGKAGQPLAEVVRRHAEKQSRRLTHRMKGAETWRLRDYYRHLRMNSDQAASEVSMLMTHGLVKQTGSHYGNPVYAWIQSSLQQKPNDLR